MIYDCWQGRQILGILRNIKKGMGFIWQNV